MIIQIRRSGQWTNIEAYTAPGTTKQDRIDSALGVGQTTAFLNINFNIPPYTLIKIDNKIYCGYSTCNKYVQNNNFFLHTISILPLEAYLASFNIGTKAFSTTGTNRTDAQKLRVLFELIGSYFGTTINLISTTQLTKSKEYQYSSGATAWDIVLDICKNNNARPVLRFDEETETFNFRTTNIIGTRKTLDTRYLSNAEYVQSMDDYCYFLQTEAKNVVDRTTTTYLNDVTCRSEEPVLTTDNAKLILPSPIESITSVYVKMQVSGSWYITGTFYDANGNVMELQSGHSFDRVGTVGDLWNTNPILQAAYNSVFYKIYTLDRFKSRQVALTGVFDENGENFRYVGLGHIPGEGPSGYYASEYYIMGRFNITPYILPKEKWDMLTAQVKSSYAFYNHGGNTIENMFATYKDDLFNILLGNNGSPMLSRDFSGYSETTTVQGRGITINYGDSPAVESSTSLAHSTDPAIYAYDIAYHPITNPKITSRKSISPLNETVWKKVSRSYNNGAAYIDFDKLMTGLNKSNDMMGDVELTIELTLPEGHEDYNAGDIINYDNIDWYISSAIVIHKIEYKTITLNLVRNYSKIAECIGVDTEYNATKNPLNSIIDRPIEFYGTFVSGLNFDTTKPYFFMISFYNANSSLIATLYKRATVQQDDNGNTVFTCEADDQYSFATTALNEGNRSGLRQSWYQDDVAYVDDNAEFYSASAKIVQIGAIDFNTSKKLPNYNGDYTSITNARSVLVRKDARERIIFTYTVNQTN